MRADALMVSLGQAETRSQARRLILDRRVQTADGITVTKPALSIPEGTLLRITGGEPYVSRAGDKLAAFLGKFPVQIDGRVALDLGASTGGFTECLLRRGIGHVTCVDVGHGQLHPRVAHDPRVVNLEGINARELHAVELPFTAYDLVVMDMSFISLTLVLPVAWPQLKHGGVLIALLKPQFEAGKEVLAKGHGVVRDPKIHARVIQNMKAFASALPDSGLIGECQSPIKGGDGNREFLLGWRKIKQR